MSSRTLALDDRLYAYLHAVSLREPPLMAQLREETSGLPLGVMQISPEQGQFMALLLRMLGARRCLEVGTFTGYSALVCALALPEDGRLITLDISEEWTAVARRYWELAGMASRIELRLGPATDTLRELLGGGAAGAFDFMFIDADKVSYAEYFELGLQLLRPGGVMAFDNVLWGGRVADPAERDPDTVAIRDLNARLHHDPRIEVSMLPVGDGLTLAWKCP